METDSNKGDEKRKKVCFFGHFGSQNFGNELTLQTVLHHLRRWWPDAEVVCVCTEPETLAATQKIETFPISRTWLKSRKVRTRLGLWLRRIFIGAPNELCRWLDAFKTLKRADMLIIPGTGLLTDAYGLLNWGPYNLFKWSVAAKLCRCKLLFVSVGAGPLYSALGRFFVKSALSWADFRSYRDNASMDCLNGIGISTKGDRVYPDLVFGLPEAMLPYGENRSRRRRVVAIGLMPYAGKYSVADPRDKTYQDYLNHLVAFTRWLLAHDYDIRLIIGEVSDGSASAEFKARLKASLGVFEENRIVDEPALSAEQLLPQIAETDVVVATRFHNIVIALILNKPVIAISFHHKCSALMTEMGLSGYCHDINQMNAGRLIEQFQEVVRDTEKLKSVIGRKVEESRRALAEQYAVIFKHV